MKLLTAAGTIAAVSLATFAHTASAAGYGNSVQNCKDAIAEQMNVSQDDVRMKVRNIKTGFGERNLRIFVYQDQPGVKKADKVIVNCKVHSKGQILAVDFVNATYPVAASTTPTKTES